MVLGVVVHGDTVKDREVTIDDLFRPVPVATKLLGVPLMYKKRPGTGGDDSNIRSNVIVRFMADPDEGMAPIDWQYGGSVGPAPPVVLARRDKIPFSEHDWAAIDDYISVWLEEMSEVDEDRSHVSDRMLTPVAMQAYIRTHKDLYPNALLPLRFPPGSLVVPHGLSESAGLNDVEGEVVQFSRDRVGVRFPERGIVAIRPERLEMRKEASLEEPAAKRQDTGESKGMKEKRVKELEQQEALAIASRFCECLHQDTFPEMGDLHLFGVGCEYRARAQEVLAVWQGAVKGGDLDADTIAKALCEGTVKPLFEETCRKLADSRNANATYAMELIKNNFAALEWDDL